MKSITYKCSILPLVSLCFILFLSGCSRSQMISTAEELNNVRNDLAGSYKLTTNITVEDWQPIEGFQGILNGDGYTITIKSINQNVSFPDEMANIGLIGTLEKDGVVKNLRTDGNISYTGTSIECKTGGIVVNNKGLIENCASKATVTAENGTKANIAGGIAADNSEGIIKNCYSLGSVTAISQDDSVASSGGIAGMNGGNISNSFSAGMIISKAVKGTSQGGGIVANNETGKIENCVAMNTVIRVLGEGVNSYDHLIGVNSAEAINNYALSTIKLFGQGFTKIKEENLREISSLQEQNWWSENVNFSFGTSESKPWKWSATNRMPILYDWEEVDFEVGKMKSAGAYGLTFFDEPQVYTGIISYDKSKDVDISFTLSPDASQITNLVFSTTELYLTPQNWKKRTRDEKKESVFKFSEHSTARTNFAITTSSGYNVMATDGSGSPIISNIVFKGGFENTAPFEVINEKVSSDMALIFDLTVTDACIYGDIKVEFNGCGTEAVYTVMKNTTTPQDIPSEILNP